MKKKLTKSERALLRFYKEIPPELERQNVNLDKYTNLEKHLHRIPSREWRKSVSNKKDYIFTDLEQVCAGEVRDQEYYCLLLMPKAAYVIKLLDFDYVTKTRWFGIFCEPYSFEQYSLDYIRKVLDQAMLARSDKKINLIMYDPSLKFGQINRWRAY